MPTVSSHAADFDVAYDVFRTDQQNDDEQHSYDDPGNLPTAETANQD
jgi:hypothetical protein